jgi:hypothetical protein
VRVPGFDPVRSGYHFANAFPAVPLYDVYIEGFGTVPLGDASNGLCGGMAFAVRDMFENGFVPPAQTSAPGSGPLYNEIVDRLIDSFELPFGPIDYLYWMSPDLPDHETDASQAGLAPHGRAWMMINEEWPQIKADLDAGRLSPSA